MTATAIAEPVRWRWHDFHGFAHSTPVEGLLLLTPGGRYYEVLEVRLRAERWQTDPRATLYTLTVVRLDPETVDPWRAEPMHWLPRR